MREDASGARSDDFHLELAGSGLHIERQFMRTLEEEIQKILLTVAVEKPRPDWCGVYTGLYVFPAMTEQFIRTCIVADIGKVATDYFAAKTAGDFKQSQPDSNSVSRVLRDAPVVPEPRANNVSP